MPDQKRPSNPFLADAARFQAPDYAGARAAGRGIIADVGQDPNNQQNVNKVMQQFAQVGGMMPGQNMEMFMRTTQNLSKMNGMTYNELLQMGRVGGSIGGQMGFDQHIGAATAMQSAGFGAAFQGMGGGSSGITGAQARQLDQELRLSAAMSPMANMLGAAMAMSEAGLLQGKSVNGINLSALSGKDPTKRQETLTNLAKMNPAAFVDMMAKAGVNPNTSAQFLGAQQANKDQIARHGIQDVVRGQQRDEVRSMLAQEAGDAFAPALKGMGLNQRERRVASMKAGDALQEAMMNMAADPKQQNLDPALRNKKLAEAVSRAVPGMPPDQVQQITAGAVRNMEERVRADPALQKFGNLQGLLQMNRGDVLGAGARAASDAERVARANMGKGPAEGPQIHGPPEPGAAGAAQPGGGPMKIVGTLTLRADGSADLNADRE